MPEPITRAERRWVLLVAAAIMLFTCLPYLVAMQPGFAGPGLHFQGFIWGVDDGNVYRSYIQQHAQGAFFVRNQYTLEPQTPRFVNLLFLSMGAVVRLTGLNSALVYHLFRLVLGVVLLYLVYLLAAEIGLRRWGRWLALLLAGLSSGLGWLVYLQVTGGAMAPEAANRLAPVDVAAGWQAMPEALTFPTLLLNALFVAGVALMAAVVLWALRAAREPGLRAPVICGLLLLVLGNVHSYDVIVLYLLVAAWLVFAAARGQLPWGAAVGRYALIGLLGAPSMLWQYHVQTVDPTWAAKYAVAKASPSLSGYLLGYGLVLLLAVIGAGYALHRARRPAPEGDGGRRAEVLLPVFWLALGAILLYAPLGFQRKLAEGLHLPMCLLAALALERWARRLPASSRPLLAAGVLVLTVPSNLFFMADCLAHMRVNNRDLAAVLLPPAYLSTEELAGVDYLAQHTGRDDIILCSSLMGNHLPPAISGRVVAGHWDETIHFGKYLSFTADFYRPGASPATRRQVLAATHAGWVVWGPEERLLQQMLSADAPGGPQTADPAADLPELRPVFTEGDMVIYAVTPFLPPAPRGT
ncbi:MAG TPA: hypothetical protein VGM19_05740 [Armatimonadota bacterium]|jgi:hypothetical protein